MLRFRTFFCGGSRYYIYLFCLAFIYIDFFFSVWHIYICRHYYFRWKILFVSTVFSFLALWKADSISQIQFSFCVTQMSQFSKRDVYSGIRTSALVSWNSILGCDLCLFPASTTLNVTHRPVTQTAAKLPIPRTPTNHQVVYTTLPAPPAQNPVRGAVMPGPGLRPVNPQTGGRGCFSSMHTLARHSLMCSTWRMWCSGFWFRFVNWFFLHE